MKKVGKKALRIVTALIAAVAAGALIERNSHSLSAGSAGSRLLLPQTQSLQRGSHYPLSSAVSAHVAAEATPAASASSEGAVDTPSETAAKRFVDGVAAVQAIDWEKVGSFSPIPRLMPARRAADAVDAGFAPEWIERSIGNWWQAESQRYQGKYAYAPVQPMALQIMSQSKSPDDAWANGMESDLTSFIARKSPANAQLLTRVFCNAEGCLCYLEDENDQVLGRPTDNVLASLRDDPMWTQTYGIKPLTFYRTGTKTWDLILIARPK